MLTFLDGKKYIGARSTELKPELDACYLGSGRYLPTRTKDTCVKVILGTYSTREELLVAETALIDLHNAVQSDMYYNKRRKVYDKFGLTQETCNGVATTTSKLKGRSAETHEYIRQANVIRSSYSGENRTPAQIEGQKKVAETLRGTKNPAKACHGVNNGGFRPWYYITPEGIRVEVYNETKMDYATKLGFTHRQITHRFHHTNIDKAGKTGIFKGWVFGDLKDE
jgi:hypothetical protein